MSDAETWLTSDVAIWGVVLLVASIVGSIVVVTFLLVQMPATYFIDKNPRGWWLDRHPILRWSARILKNVLGIALIGIGFVMVFGPTPGILTMLVGIMLIDFPGKHAIEMRFVKRPRVLAMINRLRARF